MIFYEKIGAFEYIKLLLLGKEVFYYQKTITSLLLDKILTRIAMVSGQLKRLKKLDWGDTRFMTTVDKNASFNARNYSDYLLEESRRFIDDSARLFNIDFAFIFKKYLFTEILYKKYFFYEMSLQYTRENPEKTHAFYVDKTHLWRYKDHIKAAGELYFINNYLKFEFFTSLIMIPLLLLFYWRKKTLKNPLNFENDLLCMVHSPSEYQCYKELFGHHPKTKYVIIDTYSVYFTSREIEEFKIKKLGLNQSVYKDLVKSTFQYLFLIIKHYNQVYLYGHELMKLYHKIIIGRSCAPQGKGNIFITFEHHDVIKTIRNEFIRHEGSKSVFFSYLLGVARRYYPQEYFENYDFLCSSGKYLEDQFMENEALTKHFMKTGCYFSHKRIISNKEYHERIRKLNSFKGNAITVTILLPGVCKLTYNSEVALMRLAQQLSMQQEVKVFIRKKPFEPEKKYAGFYESFVAGNNSIYLTGMEFELFDFLPPTDLFITSFSSSACDLAMRGANIYFIDYFRCTGQQYLYWEAALTHRILLSEEESFIKIMEWLNDDKNGRIRTRHREGMEQFVDYMGYRFTNFEEYRTNLINQLRMNIFCHNKALKDI